MVDPAVPYPSYLELSKLCSYLELLKLCNLQLHFNVSWHHDPVLWKKYVLTLKIEKRELSKSDLVETPPPPPSGLKLLVIVFSQFKYFGDFFYDMSAEHHVHIKNWFWKEKRHSKSIEQVLHCVNTMKSHCRKVKRGDYITYILLKMLRE